MYFICKHTNKTITFYSGCFNFRFAHQCYYPTILIFGRERTLIFRGDIGSTCRYIKKLFD